MLKANSVHGNFANECCLYMQTIVNERPLSLVPKNAVRRFTSCLPLDSPSILPILPVGKGITCLGYTNWKHGYSFVYNKVQK